MKKYASDFIFALSLFLLGWSGLPAVSLASFAGVALQDNFNSYTTGTNNLGGQGAWVKTGGDSWDVVNTGCYQGQCAQGYYNTSGHDKGDMLTTQTSFGSLAGSITFMVKFDGTFTNISYQDIFNVGYTNGTSDTSPEAVSGISFYNGTTGLAMRANNGTDVLFDNITINVWHTVTIYWVTDQIAGCRFSASIDGGTPADSQTLDNSDPSHLCPGVFENQGINTFQMIDFGNGANTYVDEITPGQYNLSYTGSSNFVGVATSTVAANCNANFSTSTSILDTIGSSISVGFCNVGVFLFVPNQQAVQNFSTSINTITAKAPFSWITSIRGDLEGLTASSSENFINLTLNFGTTTAALGIGSITVISTSTLSRYYPDSTRETARSLIGIVFALLGISFIYREVQKIWHKQV